MLIGGFVVLTAVLRVAERWCEAHPRRNEAGNKTRCRELADS
jgi:hypothetical protein